MENSELNQFSLTLKTGDKASENFIIDSQFRSVAHSVGQESTFILPKGLYSVKVRAGNQTIEKPLTLRSDETVVFDPVPFSTPVPLVNTFETSNFQIDTASSYSKKHFPDVSLGTGSKLFLFGSIYSDKQSLELQNKNTDLAIGLTLRNYKNETLIDFGKPEVGAYSWDEEPWAACDVDINPGIYCLCLETADGHIYKQTIVTSPGWQTQIFLQPRDYGITEKDVRADLISGSIFMSRIGIGFNSGSASGNPQSLDFRLTETVKQGLCNGRNVISKEVLENLYYGKFENPMLGIYAAHILLLKNNINSSEVQNLTELQNRNGVETIVNNLRNLLGRSHPDVEAIALKIGMPSDYIFNAFPMLARSWDCVVEASFERPDVVPKDSITAHFANGFWNRDLWLIWGAPVNKTNDKNLIDQIKKLVQQEFSLAKSIEASNERISLHSLMNSIINPIINNKFFRKIFGLKETLNSVLSLLDNDQIFSIIQKFGIPRSKVEELLKNANKNELIRAAKEFNIQSSVNINSDPQKGQWGGKTEVNYRKISAKIESSMLAGLFKVTITVESTNEQSPLYGTVQFYLHNTFLNPEPIIAVKNGKAILKLTGVWGGFTVGAKADDGQTKLELDLAKLENAPKEFKEK